jgi:HSP20 family protein
VAVKKTGISVSLMGAELKKFLQAVEMEERETINLGETAGPLLDLYETCDSIVIEADLPGIDPDKVEVWILNGILTIEGPKRKRVEEPGRVNYLCVERSYDAFRRILKITVPINPKKGAATYDRGILTITFPKVEEKRGEPIKIAVEKK